MPVNYCLRPGDLGFGETKYAAAHIVVDYGRNADVVYLHEGRWELAKNVTRNDAGGEGTYRGSPWGTP